MGDRPVSGIANPREWVGNVLKGSFEEAGNSIVLVTQPDGGPDRAFKNAEVGVAVHDLGKIDEQYGLTHETENTVGLYVGS